ncbi:MAG: WD40/YVTN/BNR-like repeat-containing protein, partial [Rhodanobacteraceae bacterium]
MRLLPLFVLISLSLVRPASAQQTPFSSASISGLGARNIGSATMSGRVSALDARREPSGKLTIFVGAASGGVWKSEDSGTTYRPVFDEQPVQSIGAITIDPKNSKNVWVGTGECWTRNSVSLGDGIYKSTDGGETWEHSGLPNSERISQIIVSPKSSDTVYAAVPGRLWSDSADRGLYKTTDGGKTWAQITGHGFPARTGRIGIAVSPADASRVYALVDAKAGGIYRSDDGGATWSHSDGEERIWTRGWYFGGITADPKNADELYVMNTSTYRSTDGGKSFVAIKGAPGGDDYHTLWIDPTAPERMILGTDQGVVISIDDARTWSSWYNQPIAEVYNVATDYRFPYWATGSQQDSG